MFKKFHEEGYKDRRNYSHKHNYLFFYQTMVCTFSVTLICAFQVKSTRENTALSVFRLKCVEWWDDYKDELKNILKEAVVFGRTEENHEKSQRV
jgi:hypothetical protein